jgi:hypothetical protein
MTDTIIQDRAAGAIMSDFIGDAIWQGLPWYNLPCQIAP